MPNVNVLKIVAVFYVQSLTQTVRDRAYMTWEVLTLDLYVTKGLLGKFVTTMFIYSGDPLNPGKRVLTLDIYKKNISFEPRKV